MLGTSISRAWRGGELSHDGGEALPGAPGWEWPVMCPVGCPPCVNVRGRDPGDCFFANNQDGRRRTEDGGRQCRLFPGVSGPPLRLGAVQLSACLYLLLIPAPGRRMFLRTLHLRNSENNVNRQTSAASRHGFRESRIRATQFLCSLPE